MAAMREVPMFTMPPSRRLRRTAALAAFITAAVISGCAAPDADVPTVGPQQAAPAQRLLGFLSHSPTAEQNQISSYVYDNIPQAAPVWRSGTRTLEIWLDPNTSDDAVASAISGVIGSEWSPGMGAVQIHHRQFSMAQAHTALAHLHSDPAIQSRLSRIESAQVQYDGTIMLRLDGPVDWEVTAVDSNGNPLLTSVDDIPVFTESAGLTGLLPFHSVRLS